MNTKSRLRCPACGFAVFNRRVAKCESCGAPLPAEMLFTPKDLSAIEAEHKRNDEIRRDLAKEAEEIEAKREKRRNESA